jgi:hypothetical protein
MWEGRQRTYMNKSLNILLNVNQQATLGLYPDDLHGFQKGTNRVCFFEIGDILILFHVEGFPLQRDYVAGKRKGKAWR